jgi:hypothetical protein
MQNLQNKFSTLQENSTFNRLKKLFSGGLFHKLMVIPDLWEGKQLAQENFWKGVAKMANMPGLQKFAMDWRTLLGIAGLLGVGAGVAHEIYLHHKKVRMHEEAVNRARQLFSQVVQSDPYLSQQDPKELEQIFETILQVAPLAAANPLMLRQLLRQATTYGGIDPNAALSLSELNDRIAQTQLPLRPGMSVGGALVTLGNSLPKDVLYGGG